MTLYAVTTDGNLLWYRYTQDKPVENGWATGSGTAVGRGGWNSFKQVEAAANGVIYTVTTDGNLLWYRYTQDKPADNGWATGSSSVIGRGGWNSFKQIVAAENGVIYTVTTDGNLLWYRYTQDKPVENGWATGSGTVIGRGGWNNFKQIVAGTNGVIYAVTTDGNLLWYRYTQDKPVENGWATGSGTVIGRGGWNSFKQIVAGANGIIYAVTTDGNLLWYRYAQDKPVENGWATGSGTVIGKGGWNSFKQIALMHDPIGAVSPAQPSQPTPVKAQDTKNVLTDFDLAVALVESAINAQMTAAWSAWKTRFNFQDTIRLFMKDVGGKLVETKFGVEATLAPIKLSLNVPGGRSGQVRVTLTLTSGYVRYFDEAKEQSADCPINNWSISFLADLNRRPLDLDILAKMDPAAHKNVKNVIAQSSLNENVFSIEYLFMKVTDTDLLLEGNKSINIPTTIPSEARTKALTSLQLLLNGALNEFMLGTVVRRNDAKSAPTFAMTDFVFDINGNAAMPQASTLAYLGEFSGRPLPKDLENAFNQVRFDWIDPVMVSGAQGTVAGVMAIRKGIFMDQYLIQKIQQITGRAPSLVDGGTAWLFEWSEEPPLAEGKERGLKKKVQTAKSWSLKLTFVPGTNRISIAGRLYSKAHLERWTDVPVLSVKSEWVYMAGERLLTGSVTLKEQTNGTSFQIEPVVQYAFQDLRELENEVSDLAKSSGFFEDLFGDSTAQKLQAQQKGMFDLLTKAMEEVLKKLAVNLNQHAFVPPGGGVFTHQNLRFSPAGDLLMDIMYVAPSAVNEAPLPAEIPEEAPGTFGV